MNSFTFNSSSASADFAPHAEASIEALHWRATLTSIATSTVVVVFILAGASEALLRKSVVPVDLFWRHYQFFKHADSPDAAFGDSHIARGFLGSPSMPNLAYLSESISQSAYKARVYFAKRRPGRVLLLGAPHQFSDERMTLAGRDYATIFGRGLNPYHYFELLDPYHRPRIGRYWMTWLKAGLTFPSTMVFDSHGALVSDALMLPSDAASELEAAERVASMRPVDDFEHSEAAREYARLVSDLVKRGATVCIATFPTSPAYRKYADADPRFAAARRFFDDLARSTGAKYRSYWDRFDDPAMFADADHLNRIGATKLTPCVIRDCFGEEAKGA